MCGISGIFNLNRSPVSFEVLKKMTNSIAHRGPDGEGYYTKDYIGLGHRRLSIIDISEMAKQPMVSEDKRYVLTYNGEIYNFKNIRTELKSLGYRFKSGSDSEVVLNSWIEWGENCVLKFNGMFAFSVWDENLKTLFLVRDRYGIKPLYYSQFGDVFLFASEQKSILQHPIVKKEIDHKAMYEYFTFQNIFTNRTLLKKIKLLDPASIAKIKVNDPQSLTIKTYWDYHFKEPKNKVNSNEYKEELDRLLKQAVNRHLVADVELGSYLSGGIDSGTLAALSSVKRPYIKTFTCGFDLSSASGLELSFDERQKAEAISALFKTEHYEIVLKAGDMERCLSKLTYHLEEPRVGQSYPNYYVAQLASKFVKVVLSGTGGDELFGGYPWRYYRTSFSKDFNHYVEQYYSFWQRLIDKKDIKNVFSPIWSDVQDVSTKDIFKSIFLNHENELKSPEDYINHSLYFEAKTFLHGLFLVEDKLSMSHSLETRVPFMDNDLVNFAMKCPINLKINNLENFEIIDENDFPKKRIPYLQKTKDGKQILRDVMKKYIPEYITNAEKQGFSSPDASWFKGESIEFVKDKLFDKKAPIYDFLNYNAVKPLIQSHLDGFTNKRLLIWSLLNVNQYIKTFL
jgi:asparagine synthase (glutamine-hydrolysing)